MIRVTRTDAAVPNPTAWTVGFSAEWTEDDTPAPVFVMQAAGGSMTVASFSCVASEIQMRDLPEDEPSASGPYFRVASFTSIFRTEAAVLEFQQSLLDAVQELVDERDAAAALAESATFEITPSLP